MVLFLTRNRDGDASLGSVVSLRAEARHTPAGGRTRSARFQEALGSLALEDESLEGGGVPAGPHLSRHIRPGV